MSRRRGREEGRDGSRGDHSEPLIRKYTLGGAYEGRIRWGGRLARDFPGTSAPLKSSAHKAAGGKVARREITQGCTLYFASLGGRGQALGNACVRSVRSHHPWLVVCGTRASLFAGQV